MPDPINSPLLNVLLGSLAMPIPCAIALPNIPPSAPAAACDPSPKLGSSAPTAPPAIAPPNAPAIVATVPLLAACAPIAPAIPPDTMPITAPTGFLPSGSTQFTGLFETKSPLRRLVCNAIEHEDVTLVWLPKLSDTRIVAMRLDDTADCSQPEKEDSRLGKEVFSCSLKRSSTDMTLPDGRIISSFFRALQPGCRRMRFG